MESPAADRYVLVVHPRDDDGDILVTCPAFPGLSAFGDTEEEAIQEARIALQGFMEVYQEKGWELPKPERAEFSGRLNLRMPKSLHAALAHLAEAEGVSLNTLIVTALSRLRPSSRES